MLAAEGVSSGVINMAAIKPIDEEIIIKAAKETGLIITAEEHSIIGGLGSAVSEVTSEKYPVRVIKIGVEDTYGISGPAVDLLKYHKLTAENIAKIALQAVQSK